MVSKGLDSRRRRLSFILSLEKDYYSDINKVAKRLKAIGARVDVVLPGIGIIIGETSLDQTLNELKIEGVKSVELNREIETY